VADVVLPRMAHLAFMRSPVARGTVRRIDTAPARVHPGVIAVWTAAELNGDIGPIPLRVDGAALFPPMLALADKVVRYVGDPVAVVVAEDRYVAEDACDLIDLDLETLKPVIDYEAAFVDDGRIVHPELPTNVAFDGSTEHDPDLDEAFAGAAHVFTETFRQHRQTNAPMETRGMVVDWDPVTGELTMYASMQNAHVQRHQYALAFGVPEHKIRIISRDVGGAFGQKLFLARDEVCVVLAARRLARPVKWIEDRRENLIGSNHAREEQVRVCFAVSDEGVIHASRIEVAADVGTFPLVPAEGIAMHAATAFPGPYCIPLHGFRVRVAFTNKCSLGAYRGPWMIETLSRECMVDVVARRLGMCPLELRRRNVIRELPYQIAVGASTADALPLPGLVYENITPAETLEAAAAQIDYAGFRALQQAARQGGRYLGIGLSLFVEPTAFGPPPQTVEVASIRIEPGGTVTAVLGTGSHGQSVETTMAQVVAEHLGVDIEDVVIDQGDTASAPFGGGTGGSRTAVVAGGAARAAALELRAKCVEIAAHLLEAAQADIEVQSGLFTVRGVPDRPVTMEEVADAAHFSCHRLPPGMAPGLEVTSRYAAPHVTFSNGCHACTCEVDVHTGRVHILRYVVAEDCGVMINPAVVEGQIAGGVVQGIGGVLYEEMRYDEDGNPLAATFIDYLLPTAAEVPEIEYVHIETPSGTPGGHKGMAEGGAIAAPAAIVNAIADALAPLGVEVRDQPLGPAQVLDLLSHAR